MTHIAATSSTRNTISSRIYDDISPPVLTWCTMSIHAMKSLIALAGSAAKMVQNVGGIALSVGLVLVLTLVLTNELKLKNGYLHLKPTIHNSSPLLRVGTNIVSKQKEMDLNVLMEEEIKMYTHTQPAISSMVAPPCGHNPQSQHIGTERSRLSKVDGIARTA